MLEREENKINPRFERFIKYLESKGIALRKAEELLKVGNGRLGKMKVNHTELKAVFLENILHTFQEINRDWLENGIGDMIISSSIRNQAKIIGQFPNDEDALTEGKYLFAPDGSMGMKVYTVPAKAQAGYLRGYPDPEYYDDFDYVIIPVDKKHKGEYLSFEVSGDSMVCLDSIEMAERSIFPGRVAVGRFLDRDKWYYKLHIHNYDYWVIAHKTKGILIKEITQHDVDKGIITIHSLNPAYEDEDLQLDDIEQVFSVVQIVTKTR